MFEYYLSGVLLRSCQILVDASIWIGFGCFIAAIFQNMIGPSKTKKLFGDNSRFGLLIGWAIGMLLPVCSLGVIPVLVELHRIRVKPGTIVAFGLTAPLFNPISVLYGLSLSDPFAILVFAACAVLIVTAMGALWGWFAEWSERPPVGTEKEETKEMEERLPSTGIRRSLAVLFSAAKSLAGWPLLYLAIGVLASAIVATCFANGSLQTATEPDDAFAPAFMALFVTPIYSTPLLAMSQIGGMFQHGNSVGAAFSLLILGAGVNLGVFIWFAVSFGLKRIVVFVGLLFAITLGLAYSLDKPLYPKGVETKGHTHAFDIYTHPYHMSDDLLSRAVNDANEYRLKMGTAGPAMLVVLFVLGVAFQVVQSRWDIQSWLLYPVERKSGDWDIVLPPWVIGLVACVGFVVASVFGTYIYYPAPNSVLGDLSAANAICVTSARTGDYESVDNIVGYCDDLSRRLEVGVYLRTGEISEFKRTKAKIYREKLDNLRDTIEDGQLDNIDELSLELHRSYLRLSQAFREEEKE